LFDVLDKIRLDGVGDREVERQRRLGVPSGRLVESEDERLVVVLRSLDGFDDDTRRIDCDR